MTTLNLILKVLQSGALYPPFLCSLKSCLDFKFILSFNNLELDLASCQDAIELLMRLELHVKCKFQVIWFPLGIRSLFESCFQDASFFAK